MSVHGDRLPPDISEGNSRGQLLLVALGGVLLWTALLFASQVLWHQVVGFSVGAAWALAAGLSVKIGLLTLGMVAAVQVARREH